MKKEMTYLDSVHRDGRIWNISVMIALFMYPILVGVLFGVLPDWRGLLMGLVATAPMYWAVAVVETFTYVPMLGAGGSYLSFVTGNISNLKLPVALNALEQAGANIRTEEGEIVSTIAIAVSSIVTTVIIILGVILIVLIVKGLVLVILVIHDVLDILQIIADNVQTVLQLALSIPQVLQLQADVLQNVHHSGQDLALVGLRVDLHAFHQALQIRNLLSDLHSDRSFQNINFGNKGGIIVIIPPSACQKILFAPLRPFSELFKSSENAGF